MTETAQEKMQKTLEHWRKGREEEKKIGTPLPKRFWDVRKKRSPRKKYKTGKTRYTPQGEQIIAERRHLTETDWLKENSDWSDYVSMEDLNWELEEKT